MWPRSETGVKPRAPDDLDYPPAGDRPWLPAAQEPGTPPRHRTRLRHRPRVLPGGERRALLGRCPGRRRPGRPGARADRGRTIRPGPLRELPAVRGVVVPLRGPGTAV